MKVEVKDIGPGQKQLQVVIEADQVKDEYEKALDQWAKNVALPGFRKGKVPKALISKRYGDEVRQNVKQDLITSTFQEALEEQKFDVVGQPRFENLNLESEDLTYDATVDLRPEVTLGEYKKLKATRLLAEIDDQAVADTLSELRKSRGVLVPVEGKAKKGDTLIVDMALSVDGEEIESESATTMHAGHDHVMSYHVDGMGKASTGKKAGDQISSKLTLPDWHQNHAGKEADLSLSIQEVKRHEEAELDEDFLSEFNVEDEQGLRGQIKERLEKQAEVEGQHQVQTDLCKQLVESHSFDVPPSLIEHQAQSMAMQSQHDQIALYSLPEDQRMEKMKELIKNRLPEAEQLVKQFFILEAIAKKEKIFVSEDDVRQRVQMMAAMRQMDGEALYNDMLSQGQLSEIRASLREEQTLKWLVEKADITDKKEKASKKDKKKAEASS